MKRLSNITLTALGLAIGASGCQDESDLALPTTNIVQSQTARVLGHDKCTDPRNLAHLRAAMIEAINTERAKHRLEPLRPNVTLDQIADFYACRLVEGAFFSHVDPYDGSSIASRSADFGYAYWKVGENLAAGQMNVERAMSDWLASPGHRANLLDPAYTELGIAIKSGGENGPYWVQEFGRPLTDGPPPAELVETSAAPKKAEAPASQPTAGDAFPDDSPDDWP